MNTLQEKEFELLKILDSVCKKLDIPYFLVCGSALGAVKYGGFIPWDDDIDVGMLRSDYEHFKKSTSELLPEGIFLQNADTDPAFPQIYSKLRNSRTTYIESSARHLPINHGIFIDIFPLDGYPSNHATKKWFEWKKRIYANMLLSAYDIPRTGLSKFTWWIWSILRVPQHTQTVVRHFENHIRRYSIDESKFICNHGNWQGKLEYAPAHQYGRGKQVSFEGMSALIPEDFDAYLTQKYGNWRQDIPTEQQTGHHTYEYCSCTKPYFEYLEEIKNGQTCSKEATKY